MRRAPYRYLLPRLAPAILTLTLAHAALALAEDQIRAGQQTTL